jgi:hypothetical protein
MDDQPLVESTSDLRQELAASHAAGPAVVGMAAEPVSAARVDRATPDSPWIHPGACRRGRRVFFRRGNNQVRG